MELYELINDGIMDDLRFTTEQKKLLRPEIIEEETRLTQDQPPTQVFAVTQTTDPWINVLATAIAKAAIILPQIEHVGVKE